MGSWKTIAISFPRISRISLSLKVRRSQPSNMISPSKRTEPSLARISIMVRDKTLLPEPDSPTMPRVFPRSKENDTPSTARAMPLGVSN